MEGFIMAQQTSIPSPSEAQNPDDCRHHWVIQPATGPISQGSCRSCGAVKEFKNYVESAAWGDNRAAARAKASEANVAPVAVDDPEDASDNEE